MHVYTRDKAELRQSVMQPGERQLSLGVHPSFAKNEAAIRRSNHALSLGDAPSGNSSRDGNGTLIMTFVVKRCQAITDCYRELACKGEYKRKRISENFTLFSSALTLGLPKSICRA